MNRRLVLTLVLVTGILLLGLVPGVFAAPRAQAEIAQVRLVHAVPDAPAVDVLIDGGLVASSLTYLEATPYILLMSGGEHTISIQAGGVDIVRTSLTINGGQNLTALMMGTAEAIEINTFEDDLSGLVPGNTRLSAINALSGVEAVDIILPDGSPVFQDLAYGASSGGIDIPANTYPLVIVSAGGSVEQALTPAASYALQAGMLYRLLVTGGVPTALMLETPVQAPADSVNLRLAHAIEGAPAVDVYANDMLIVPGLAAGEMTQYMALPLGTYEISMRTAGEQNVASIAQIAFDVSNPEVAGQASTIAAVDKGDSLGLQIYQDDFSILDSGTGRISLLNALPGSSLTAALSDGTTLTAGTPFDSAATSAQVPAGDYTLTLTDEASGKAITSDVSLTGGTLTSVLVAGPAEQPLVITGTTALNVQPGSVVAAVAEVIPTTTPEILVTEEAPTEVPAVPTETPVPVEIAAAPTATLAPTTAPVAQPLPAEGPVGLVYNLDPGANLQLRQYPNSAALSIGRVSSGTVLSILGRAGEPDFPNLVDLPPNADLDPMETWLSVLYNTPEGGTVEAWATAQYVHITEDGKPVRLADLEPLRSDIPGTASGSTVAQPTAAPADAEFYAVVFNLNPDARLNIRRTPETIGEVLAGVGPGTILEPTGILEDLSWTFVTFRPEGGGTITGWVSTEFLQFVFRGKMALPTAGNIDEYLQRSVLLYADPTRRGEISPEAAAAAGATPTPAAQSEFYLLVFNLDPGANLNIRRTPDTLAEILAAVPSGTILEPVGILEDLSWTFVRYLPPQGGEITGWASTEFLQFAYRGRTYRPLPEYINEFLQRGLVIYVDPTLRGEVSAEAVLVTPTAAPSDAEFYSVVFNLFESARLNVRRTPDTLAEILVAVPPGTILLPVGILEDLSWTFVTFLPEGGGTITGWASTEFLQFVFRGRASLPTPENIEEYLQRGLLLYQDPTTRGEVSDDAVTAGGSSADTDASRYRNQYVGTVVSAPGANLHLRQTPDAASRSLALIPSGAIILIEGRTADAGWLQAEYDNMPGWVASAYVGVTRNGQRVAIQDIPVVQ